MTSKSPDSNLRADDSVVASSSGRASAGSDSPAAKLDELRDAITEIDQRHAEGESGIFANLAGDGEDGAAKTGGRSASRADDVESTRSVPDFLPEGLSPEGLSFDDQGEAGDYDADYSKAKKSAMNMLAMRDHSSAELREKLIKRELMPEAVDDLIAKLQKSRLLNDEEFAHRYVRAHRERRKLSQSALRRELGKKGIPAELISNAVDDVDGEEELARQVAEKKAASSRGLDYKVRERRILGMLARRGFSSTVCIKVTREVLAEV